MKKKLKKSNDDESKKPDTETEDTTSEDTSTDSESQEDKATDEEDTTETESTEDYGDKAEGEDTTDEETQEDSPETTTDDDTDETEELDEDELEAASAQELLKKLRKQNSENAKFRHELKRAQAENLRLKVSIEKGLPPKLANRLNGETEEELMKDADELLSLVGKKPRLDIQPKDGEPRGGDTGEARMKNVLDNLYKK